MTNKIIEICGLPATGKTTSINNLKVQLSKIQHFDKLIFIDDPSLMNPLTTKKTEVDFNIWNLNTIINSIIAQEDMIIIVEKGLYDLYAWVKYHFTIGNVTTNEYDLLSSYILNSRWIEQTTKLIMLSSTSETIFKRRPLNGRIINQNVIGNLNLAYNHLEMYAQSQEDTNFIKIDTDELSIVEANKLVLEEVEKSINSNLHFV